jgi:hypothetical protein
MIPDSKVNETLKLMGRPAGDRLTPEVTREFCQRTGSKAMLTGSIAGLGNQYVIGLKAVNCQSGDLLAEAQERAASKEGVLNALNAAAVPSAEQAGRVAEHGTGIRYTIIGGNNAVARRAEDLQPRPEDGSCERPGQAAAMPFYKRAVELDPNFASAYFFLSNTIPTPLSTKRNVRLSPPAKPTTCGKK